MIVLRMNNNCSNRTFMELKCGKLRFPVLWELCSNRTFMELKCWLSFCRGVRVSSSNRTFMELKLLQWSHPCWLHRVLIVPLWN